MLRSQRLKIGFTHPKHLTPSGSLKISVAAGNKQIRGPDPVVLCRASALLRQVSLLYRSFFWPRLGWTGRSKENVKQANFYGKKMFYHRTGNLNINILIKLRQISATYITLSWVCLGLFPNQKPLCSTRGGSPKNALR